MLDEERRNPLADEPHPNTVTKFRSVGPNRTSEDGMRSISLSSGGLENQRRIEDDKWTWQDQADAEAEYNLMIINNLK